MIFLGTCSNNVRSFMAKESARGLALWERLLRLQLLQNWAKIFPDVFGHDFMAFDSRVDAIGQVQFRMSADAFEQKRNENGLVLLRELDEGLLKVAGVIRAEIGWHLHPRNKD